MLMAETGDKMVRMSNEPNGMSQETPKRQQVAQQLLRLLGKVEKSLSSLADVGGWLDSVITLGLSQIMLTILRFVANR